MTEPIFLSKVGQRIKDLRAEKKIKQQELAQRCEFEKASMSRIESGRTNVTILTLRKISNVLEVPLADFFKEI